MADERLRNYEAFLAIVDTGNLTRAAARLRRSLQSVSRSLAALEEQVGVELVRRTTRQARPTEAGLVFHGRVSAALGDIAAAEAELRETTGALRGTLRIAASAFFAARYLVPAIRELALLHPALEFDLRIAESYSEPVQTGADLMIRIGQLPASPLKARRLAMIRRVVVAAPSYLGARERPVRPADLAKHVCLVRSSAQDARTWTFDGPDGEEHVTVKGRFTSDNAYVVNHALLAGLGVGIAAHFQVHEAIEHGRLEVLLGKYALPPTPVYAVLPATRTPPRVRRFLELLEQRLKKDMP